MTEENMIDPDQFFGFCEWNGAGEKFMSQLHLWLDKYESENGG